jgi:hypothetical protein
VLEASIVRIGRRDQAGTFRAHGAGFLIDHRHILTCAHVVNSALGRPRQSGDRPDALLSFDFPDVAFEQILHGQVVQWVFEGRNHERDFALLEIDGKPPSAAVPAPIVRIEPGDIKDREVWVRGFPKGFEATYAENARARVGRPVGPFFQLDTESDVPVVEGFSGAPVWDEDFSAVVGMVVTHDRSPTTKVAFISPAYELAKAWPGLDRLLQEARSSKVQRTLDEALLATESSLAARTAQATNQLTNEHGTVRLGAIRELEHIARDSQRQHGAIMQVIVAYILERKDWLRGDLERERQLLVGIRQGARARPEYPKLPPDLQAAATALLDETSPMTLRSSLSTWLVPSYGQPSFVVRACRAPSSATRVSREWISVARILRARICLAPDFGVPPSMGHASAGRT